MDGGGGQVHRSLRNDTVPMITPFQQKRNRIPLNGYFQPEMPTSAARIGSWKSERRPYDNATTRTSDAPRHWRATLARHGRGDLLASWRLRVKSHSRSLGSRLRVRPGVPPASRRPVVPLMLRMMSERISMREAGGPEDVGRNQFSVGLATVLMTQTGTSPLRATNFDPSSRSSDVKIVGIPLLSVPRCLSVL